MPDEMTTGAPAPEQTSAPAPAPAEVSTPAKSDGEAAPSPVTSNVIDEDGSPLRKALAKAHADIAKRDAEPEKDAAPKVKAEKTESEKAAKPAPKRAEDGKFASDKPKPVAAQKVETPKAATEADDDTPPTWKERAERFKALDPETRAFVKEREAAFEKVAPRAQVADKIDELLSPYSEAIKAAGLDAPKMVERWIAAENTFMRDPVAGFKWIAELYPLNDAQKAELAKAIGLQGAAAAAQAADVPPADDDDPYQLPEVKALRTQIKALEDKIADSAKAEEAKAESVRRAAYQQAQNEVNAKLEQLSSEYGERFETLRYRAGALLKAGKADSMEHAMKLADEEARSRYGATTQQQSDADRRRAQDALAAGSLNVRGATPATEGVAGKDWRETLRLTANRLAT